MIATNSFSVGEFVQLSGITSALYMNGFGSCVQSTGLSGSQFQFQVFNFDYPFVITNVALTTNVVTITCNNHLVVGATVTLAGLTTATYLNGQTVTILPGGLTATSFTASFTHGNDATHSDTGSVSYSTGIAGMAVPVYSGNQNYLFSAPTVLMF